MRGAEAFSSVGEPDVSRVFLNSHNAAVEIIVGLRMKMVDREGNKEDGGSGIGMAIGHWPSGCGDCKYLQI